MDHEWSPNVVLACVFWTAGAAVILFDMFVPSADDIGHIGIGLVLAGKVFYDRELVRSLVERERSAFSLGRESATIRPVRDL